MNSTLEKFQTLYSDFAKADLSKLSEVYFEDASFRDPVHRLTGLKNIKDYFHNSSQGLLYCRFEFLDVTESSHQAWVRWRMDYAHQKLKGGQALHLDGASQLLFERRESFVKIIFHEDFYDMGAMLYEHVPVLKWLIKRLKNRLAAV